ncbi:plasmid stabilization protein [Aquamicrobium sp. LC103]|uniref:FitA-like ribbon-helix-helix domain-containing protein n=1 Tax=Aquamicrobium sp. LC103 TaxID=1120658 RepID=UPI00063ED1C2|nr:plasmid stabilization protein [Aquamicrobium sp. LC103]TKT74993.1 plasmid stabilization protein [Aquamicrobium sp. LC103]
MGDLLIRNIPDALRHELAEEAAKDGNSLSAEAIDILRQGLLARRNTAEIEGKSAWEQLRAILRPDDEEDDTFSKVMDEIEAERKRDFGRPLPDFE